MPQAPMMLRSRCLKVLSALAFTVMSAGVKSLADRYPTGEIVFFRSLQERQGGEAREHAAGADDAAQQMPAQVAGADRRQDRTLPAEPDQASASRSCRRWPSP
jgi:hypothetical protein